VIPSIATVFALDPVGDNRGAPPPRAVDGLLVEAARWTRDGRAIDAQEATRRQ
jgi:hypothetical protein